MKKDPAFNTPEEIRALQNEKLRSTVQHIAAHSKFYQAAFEDNGVDPDSIQSVKDLDKLPFTVKDDLRRSNDDLLCVGAGKVLDLVRTSGTQGAPVNVSLSDQDLDRLARNEALSFSNAGLDENSLLQLMTTMDRQFMAGLAYFLGSRELGAGMIRVGAANPEMHWGSIMRLRPSHLIVVPSFLLKMIEFAHRQDIDMNASSVQAAICIGEPIRDADLQPNTLARKINEHWQIRLFSSYASTEMATAFTECEAGMGGHLLPGLLVMEVLDGNDRPVADGETGELVVTPLGVEAMPLLRFRTGDIVTLYTGKCSCGRNTPRLGPVLGRKEQMIKFKGTTLYPQVIIDAMHGLDGIGGFIVQISKDELGLEEVKVLVSGEIDDARSTMIKEHLKARLRVVPELEVLEQGELDQLRFPGTGRKPIQVLDNR